MTMIRNFLFSFIGFCIMISFFLTKPLVCVNQYYYFFLTNSSYSVFLATLFFATLSSLLKSTGVVSNFPMSNLSILIF